MPESTALTSSDMTVTHSGHTSRHWQYSQQLADLGMPILAYE